MMSKFVFSNIVKKVLNEMLSRVVYHFTDFYSFYCMVDKDAIKFSPVERSIHSTKTDILSNYGRYKFFLSTTRQRNSGIGYSGYHNVLDVRITLNTFALNSKLRAKPVNFFFNVNGGRSDKEVATDPKLNKSMIKSQIPIESEDRIFSNEKFLHHIENFIERVDIYLKENCRYRESQIQDVVHSKIGDRIFFYGNKKDYDFQRNDIDPLTSNTIRRGV